MLRLLLLCCGLTTAALCAQSGMTFDGSTGHRVDFDPTLQQDWTLFFRIRSTATRQSPLKSHGSYDRIFGTNGFAVELADKNGQLAFYTGRSWVHLDVPLREDYQNVVVTATAGRLNVIVGKDTLRTTSWVGRRPLPSLVLGSKSYGGEYFRGDIAVFAAYDRRLTAKELSQLMRSDGRRAQRLQPVVELTAFPPGGASGVRTNPSSTIVRNSIAPPPPPPAPRSATRQRVTLLIEHMLGESKVMSGRIVAYPNTPAPGKYELTVTKEGFVTLVRKEE